MRYVPYVWVRWNQNFYNLDIHRNYMYFHDPIWSKRSVKYDPDQYYGFKKLWIPQFWMVFKDFQGFSSWFSWTEGGINKKQIQKSRKSRKITRVRSLSRFFFNFCQDSPKNGGKFGRKSKVVPPKKTTCKSFS